VLKRPAPVPRVIDPRMPRWWELLVAVLSVVSCVFVVIEWSLERTAATEGLRDTLETIDIALCGVFLVDFAIRLGRSESRLRFLRANWIELLGALPLIGPLRAIRLVRVARLVRLWRTSHLLRRRFDVGLPPELANLGALVLVVWAACGGLFYLAEAGQNEHIVSIEDALWWAMTTLSTVGYGDIYPVTQPGRLIALATMVMGVGTLGALAATLATALLDIRERGKRGLRSWNVQEHLLVLGWNSKSETALKDFRLDPRYQDMPIVVVAETDATPSDDPQVMFVRGNPSRREALERASASKASVAMVFAKDPSDARSDHHTALTVLTLRRVNPNVKIGAELVDSDNREHLTEVGCDAVIDFSQLGAMLLVRGIQDVGVTEVIEDLLSNAAGSELYRVKIDEDFVGKTYQELALALFEKDVAVIGLERGDTRILNPDRTTALEASDHLFVVAREPP
jgi:voltage-gated potassium channel